MLYVSARAASAAGRLIRGRLDFRSPSGDTHSHSHDVPAPSARTPLASALPRRGPRVAKKTLIIDGRWTVVGSTNFDNRSFRLNDEVNLATLDSDFAEKVTKIFMNDIADSRLITYEDWRRRSILERAQEMFGRLIERQQ